MDLSQGLGWLLGASSFLALIAPVALTPPRTVPVFSTSDLLQKHEKMSYQTTVKCVMSWRKIARQSSQVVLVEQPKKDANNASFPDHNIGNNGMLLPVQSWATFSKLAATANPPAFAASTPIGVIQNTTFAAASCQ